MQGLLSDACVCFLNLYVKISVKWNGFSLSKFLLIDEFIKIADYLTDQKISYQLLQSKCDDVKQSQSQSSK